MNLSAQRKQDAGSNRSVARCCQHNGEGCVCVGGGLASYTNCQGNLNKNTFPCICFASPLKCLKNRFSNDMVRAR